MNLLLLVLGTLLPLLVAGSIITNPRQAVDFSGKVLGGKTLQAHADELQKQHKHFGALQTVGACCDEPGAALDISSGINLNEIFGSAKVVDETVRAMGCDSVNLKKLDFEANATCSYALIYATEGQPNHKYAANCVPASVCASDVVGMTKGFVVPYGVVMQVLQQNLGDLAFLGQGPNADCLAAMNKVNTGKLDSLQKVIEHKFGHIVLHRETVFDVPGMEKMTLEHATTACEKDDSELNYLFIHKNKYWSKERGAVSLPEFIDEQEQKVMEKEGAAVLEQAKEMFPQKDEKAHKARHLAEVVI